MCGIGRKPEQLGIGHGHEAIDFLLRLDHLTHMVVQSRSEAHLTCDFADLVTTLA